MSENLFFILKSSVNLIEIFLCNFTTNLYCMIIFPQFPITALREIKILQLLRHENVVNLIEICRTKGICFMLSMF